jgi:hypothetical protein
MRKCKIFFPYEGHGELLWKALKFRAKSQRNNNVTAATIDAPG